MRIELWQGTSKSKQLIGYAEVEQLRDRFMCDGRLYKAVSPYGTGYLEEQVPTVTLIPVDEPGPTPGNWFGPPNA